MNQDENQISKNFFVDEILNIKTSIPSQLRIFKDFDLN